MTSSDITGWQSETTTAFSVSLEMGGGGGEPKNRTGERRKGGKDKEREEWRERRKEEREERRGGRGERGERGESTKGRERGGEERRERVPMALEDSFAYLVCIVTKSDAYYSLFS